MYSMIVVAADGSVVVVSLLMIEYYAILSYYDAFDLALLVVSMDFPFDYVPAMMVDSTHLRAEIVVSKNKAKK